MKQCKCGDEAKYRFSWNCRKKELACQKCLGSLSVASGILDIPFSWTQYSDKPEMMEKIASILEECGYSSYAEFIRRLADEM